MKCPRCGNKGNLKPEKYESTEIDRCTSCGGVWLDENELLLIVAKKEAKFDKNLIEETIQNTFIGTPKGEKDSVELCPKCNKAMMPLNYDYSSGIIIDCCKQHGLWFDKDELDKIQAHREHWETETKKNRTQWLSMIQETEQSALKDFSLNDQAQQKRMGAFRYLIFSLFSPLFRD